MEVVNNMADINNDNSFMIRLRSSVIITIIAVAAIMAGGYVLWAVLGIVSIIGLNELYKVVGIDKKNLGYVGWFGVIAWYILLLFRQTNQITVYNCFILTLALIAFLLVIMLAVFVAGFPDYSLEQLAVAFLGVFYVGFSLSFIYLTRMTDGGNLSVWLVFLGSWGADTSAYVVGRKIGRHKITPKLSPKKSLEGFIGGVVGAALLSFIFSFIFRNSLAKSFSNPCLVFTITAAIASVISMFGDLAASAIKRQKQVKDYGKLIPGHGGILDRFDSVIFVAPMIYLLLWFLN